MRFDGEFDAYDENVFTISWPESQLQFYLVLRNAGFRAVKEAVYILMDKYRRQFYIGETGSTKGGGVYNRFQSHKHDKDFWDRALVIEDRNHSFAKDNVRRYFEWMLNKIAKEKAQSDLTFSVLSKAGPQDALRGAEKRLKEILSVCRFIGIPWAFAREGIDADDRQKEMHQVEALSVVKARIRYCDFWEALKSHAMKNVPSVGSCLTQKGLEQQWYSVHQGLGTCHIDLGASLSRGWIKMCIVVDKTDQSLRQKVLAHKEAVGQVLGEKVEVGCGKSLTVYSYHSVRLTDKVTWPSAFDWYIEKLPLLQNLIRDVVDGKSCRPTRVGVTQLARIIAERYNNGKAAQHAAEILSGRFPVKTGKWRDILEKIGVKFNSSGFVVEWKDATRNL